jgi:Mn-containing catalase
MGKPQFSIGFLKPTPGIVDEFFNASTGAGDEGDTDLRGPWQTSFGLHSVDSQMNGGPGLSVDDIHGTDGKEDRGHQDSAPKATTSIFAEALSQTHPSTHKAGLQGNGNGNGSGHKSDGKTQNGNKSKTS